MLADTITRLEQATGPDRVLDGMIFKACFHREGDVWEKIFDDIWHRQDREDSVAYQSPEYFTENLDAALTLVPRNHRTVLWISEYKDSVACLILGDNRGNDEWGNTPALALCIAALKARQERI